MSTDKTVWCVKLIKWQGKLDRFANKQNKTMVPRFYIFNSGLGEDFLTFPVRHPTPADIEY